MRTADYHTATYEGLHRYVGLLFLCIGNFYGAIRINALSVREHIWALYRAIAITDNPFRVDC